MSHKSSKKIRQYLRRDVRQQIETEIDNVVGKYDFVLKQKRWWIPSFVWKLMLKFFFDVNAMGIVNNK